MRFIVETGNRQTKCGQIRSTAKKRSSEIFDIKMETFPKKRSFENYLVRDFFPSPKLGAKSPCST